MRSFFLAAALLLAALPASGQSTTWTASAGTSDWCTAGNWTSGAPDAATAASVNSAPGGVAPEVTGAETCAVEAASLSVNVAGRVLVSGGAVDVGGTLFSRAPAANTGIEITGGTVTARAVTLRDNHTGRFTGGTLRLTGGELTTRSPNFSLPQGVFRPQGMELRMAGGTIDFPRTGLDAGRSFVDDLVIESGTVELPDQRGLWVAGQLTLEAGASLVGENSNRFGNLYLTTRLPDGPGLPSPSALLNLRTHFYGTRTIASGESVTVPSELVIGNNSATDGLGGSIRVEAGGLLTVGATLDSYTDAEGEGLEVVGGEAEVGSLTLRGDASDNYVGGEVRLVAPYNLSSGIIRTSMTVFGGFQPQGTLFDIHPLALSNPVRFYNGGLGAGQASFENLTVSAGTGVSLQDVWVRGTLLANDVGVGANPVHLVTALPTLTGSATYGGDTFFYGTRTQASGESYTLGGNLQIGTADETDGLGGEITVPPGATFTVTGALTTYADAEGPGVNITGGDVIARTLQVPSSDATGSFSGGTLLLTGTSASGNPAQSTIGGAVQFGTRVITNASGTNIVTEGHRLSVASPGTGPGQTSFGTLKTEGLLVLSTPVWVRDTLHVAQRLAYAERVQGAPFLFARSGGPVRVVTAGTALTVSGVDVDGLTVSGHGLALDLADPARFVQMKDFTNTAYWTSAPKLTIRSPGGMLPLQSPQFNGNNQSYALEAEDTAPADGDPLVIPVLNPVPQAAVPGQTFTEAGGADVIWDPGVSTLEVTGTEGWRMVSSSFPGTTYDDLLGPIWTQGFTGSDAPTAPGTNAFTYNEAVTTDTNNDGEIDKVDGYVPLQNQASGVPAGVGHFVYVFADDDGDLAPDPFPKTSLQFSATLNPAPFVFDVSFTDSPADDVLADGWNMLGNPWETGMDWDATGWARTGVTNTLYVWDHNNPGGPQYLAWNGTAGGMGSGVIAPHQGFWAKATGANPALQAPAAAKASGGTSYNLTGNAPEATGADDPVIALYAEGTLTGADGTTAERGNGAWLAFLDGATPGADDWDAFELEGDAAASVSLFWRSPEGYALDVSALPPPATDLDLPLDVAAFVGGAPAGAALRLTWPDVRVPAGWTLELTDTATGARISLADEASYAFTMDAASAKASGGSAIRQRPSAPPFPRPLAATPAAKTDAARFVLSLRLGAATDSEGGPQATPTFALDAPAPNPARGSVALGYSLAESSAVRLAVYDALGREVAVLASGESAAGRYAARLDAGTLAPGVYVVRLETAAGARVKRLTVAR